MNRSVENKVPPPQYKKIQQQNASTASVHLGSTTSNHAQRKKTTVLQKIGVWNAGIISIGSLCVLGVLGFLWYLASLFAIYARVEANSETFSGLPTNEMIFGDG